MFKKLIWYLSSKTLPFKGKERIISLITRPNKNYYNKILRNGVYWSLYGKDLIEFSIAVRNINSNHVYNYLSEYIESRNIKVLWDIGANIGSISLPLLKKFNKLKSVMFEPNPEVCGRLIRNLHNNPTLVSQSIIMNIALLNINKFIEWININNNGSFKFNHTNDTIEKYIAFIRDNYKNTDYINIMKTVEKYFKKVKGNKKNEKELETLRMTLHES